MVGALAAIRPGLHACHHRCNSRLVVRRRLPESEPAMVADRMARVLLVAACGFAPSGFAPSGLAAQSTSNPEAGGSSFGGSLGTYGFLTGTSPGGALHLASRISRPSLTLDAWAAVPPEFGTPLVGIDGGGMAITSGKLGVFIKGGLGVLLGEVYGIGPHVGVGVLAKSHSFAVRAAATARTYLGGGTVPVVSLEVGVVSMGRARAR